MASSQRCVPHGAGEVMALAPRFRKWSKSRVALWGRNHTPSARLDCPLACATYFAHPKCSTANAVDKAYLPRMRSACEI
jgi:hypothetical protein